MKKQGSKQRKATHAQLLNAFAIMLDHPNSAVICEVIESQLAAVIGLHRRTKRLAVISKDGRLMGSPIRNESNDRVVYVLKTDDDFELLRDTESGEYRYFDVAHCQFVGDQLLYAFRRPEAGSPWAVELEGGRPALELRPGEEIVKILIVRGHRAVWAKNHKGDHIVYFAGRRSVHDDIANFLVCGEQLVFLAHNDDDFPFLWEDGRRVEKTPPNLVAIHAAGGDVFGVTDNGFIVDVFGGSTVELDGDYQGMASNDDGNLVAWSHEGVDTHVWHLDRAKRRLTLRGHLAKRVWATGDAADDYLAEVSAGDNQLVLVNSRGKQVSEIATSFPIVVPYLSSVGTQQVLYVADKSKGMFDHGNNQYLVVGGRTVMASPNFYDIRLDDEGFTAMYRYRRSVMLLRHFLPWA